MTDESKDSLSSKQKKFLKGIGHHLNSLIYIGKEGLSDSLIEATKKELKQHELIKVKIGKNSPIDKKSTAEALPLQADCQLVQLIGKTLLLYKANPKRKPDERIRLPKN
ncbi:MAG: ribosome assembly RNA-binding protein YhbY [Thermodesulfobacteriota bacterium]